MKECETMTDEEKELHPDGGNVALIMWRLEELTHSMKRLRLKIEEHLEIEQEEKLQMTIRVDRLERQQNINTRILATVGAVALTLLANAIRGVVF